jgi:colanic acid biosynthesis protein WcaH
LNDSAGCILYLSLNEFAKAVGVLPLVSMGWVLTDLAGQLLGGKRSNAPAQGKLFAPGGRVHKGESCPLALERVAIGELGCGLELAVVLARRAQLMGAWDH